MAVTTGQLAKQLEQSAILTADQLLAVRQKSGLTDDGASGDQLAKQLVKQGQLTKFQAQLAYHGKAKNLVMGSYVILEKLGEGGMGQVYKARHKRMKREVALKVLAPQFVKDEGALQRFHREVEAAARLTHQNIVTAYDADETRGTHYLVMEYVRGEDLSQIIKKSGPLSVGQAVNCVLQAATGLAYAHNQGVVHRDIKPSNLLYFPATENESRGTVKILDMGLARFDEVDADSAAALTGTGMLMGTIDYMAPEQAMDSKTADHRADIYSLGATLYYLITGQPMYADDTVMKRIMAHQATEIPRLPIDDKDLQALFERMVAKKAVDRIEPAQLVVSELESWQARHQGSSAAAIIHRTSASATAEQLGETVIKPADDTSPTSSEYQATVVPQGSSPKRKAKPAITVDQSAQSEVVVNIDAEAEPVLPSQRRTARERRRKLTSKPQRKSKPSSSGSGGLFSNRKLLMAGGGGLAALLLLGVILFRFSGKDGTVVVEMDGDLKVATVEIDDNQVSFTPAGTDKQLSFKVDPGKHKLSIKTTDGLELTTTLGTDPLEITSGDELRLKAWVVKSVRPKIDDLADINRTIAERFFEITIDKSWLSLAGVSEPITRLEDVPHDPFLVSGINGVFGPEFSDADLNLFAQSPELTLLGIGAHEPTLLTDAGIEVFSKLPAATSGKLQNLSIKSGDGITDASIPHLNSIDSVLYLQLDGTQISSAGLHTLELPKLRQLKLARMPNVTSEGFEGVGIERPDLAYISVLSSNLRGSSLSHLLKPPLKSLTVGMAKLDDKCLEGLQSTSLEQLDFTGNPEITDQSAGQFDQIQGLIRFGLQHTGVGDVTCEQLAQMYSLKELDLSRTFVTDAGLKFLAKLKKLKTLQISGNPALTETGLRKLQAALPNCKIESDFSQSLDFSEMSKSLAESASTAPIQPDKPADALPKAMPPVNEKSEATAAIETTRNIETAWGDLAPLERRMLPRAKGLPEFRNTLRAGQPLGQFAAVSGPEKVKDIISWSIEPVLHRGGFRSIDVREDGLIVTGGFDGVLRIWTKDWQLVKILPGHANSVNEVQFSPDGKMLASVSSGPRDMLAVWDVDTGQLLKFHDVDNWQGHLAWRPDGNKILHVGRPKTELLAPLSDERTLIQELSLGGFVAYSPDGARFAASTDDGTNAVAIVESETGKLLKTLSNTGAFLDWSGDGKWIAIRTDSTVGVFDTRSFQKRHDLSASGFAKFSPDSTSLAISGNGLVAVFNTSDWSERFRIQAGVGAYEFAWTPDSQSIVTPVCVLDAKTGERTNDNNHLGIPDVTTAVSSDGRIVATATGQRMRIWKGENGQLVNEFSIPQMPNSQLLWQPNGKHVLRLDEHSADSEDRLSLIDTESGKVTHRLVGHDENVRRVCWSPDGNQVASVGNDGVCRIWNAESGKEVRTLVHDDALWWVQWAHDGSKIATGSMFSEIRVWDAADGRSLREFKTLSEPLSVPKRQPSADGPFCFLKNTNQIFYMAGHKFEILDVQTGQITSLGTASISGGDRLSVAWSPDFSVMGLSCGYNEFHLIRKGEEQSFDVRYFTKPHWLADSRRVLGGDNATAWVAGYDIKRRRRLGTLFPELPNNAWAVVGPAGQLNGSENAATQLVVAALHQDGRLLTLSLDEFGELFKWKTDKKSVTFLK